MTRRPTATSTICTTCGGAIYAGDRFCGSCGALVSSGGGESVAAPDNPTQNTPTQPAGYTSFDGWERIVQRLRAATLGEFEIRRELGRGGMAIVFLAQDIALRRKVAIKLMSPGLLTNDEMVRKFRDEAVTVAQMSHPNIITIHAVRAVEDLHFFIMKFVEGESLDQVLRDTQALPFPLVRGILFQVGNALSYAHRRGIIHRDIKPANILIDVEGDALVTDFGIAKAIDSESHTKTGSVVGTPAYMSPEQCYALPATWASDQYSLGVVAYEMVAGIAPFTGPSFAVMKAHADDPPPPIRDVRPDCPPELEAAILRMLAKKPEDRFPSIGQALTALEAKPLHEDDPHRIELAALVRKSVPTSSLTPVSPVPNWTRGRPTDAENAKPSASVVPAAPAGSSPTAQRPVSVPTPPSTAEAPTVDLGAPTGAPTARIDTAAAPAPAANAAGVRRRGLGVGALIVTAAALFWFVVVRRAPAPGASAAPDSAASAAGQPTPPAPVDTAASGVRTPASAPVTLPPTDSARPVPAPSPTATTSGTPAAPSPPPSATSTPVATPAPAKSIVVSPPELTLMVGQTVQPDVAVLGADNRALPGRRVVWVSPNAAVATVDRATGAVTGVTEGTTEMRATSGDAHGTLRVRVEAPVVLASIVVDQPRRLNTGENITLSAVPRDSRGNVMANKAVTWSSADAAVATIGASTGVVTAVGPGSTDITASADGKTTTVRLTVTSPPPAEPARAAAPDPAVEERRARDAIESAVRQYVATLRTHDARRVTSLYHAESDQDRKNEQALMRLMEGVAKLTAADPRIAASRIDGANASVDFTIPMTWRNPFGRIKEQSVTFRADLQRDGAEWRIATSRVVGTLTP